MSIPAVYTKVINGLLQKSLSKDVIWDTTTDANTFVVYFEKSSLTLHRNQNETRVSIDIINESGEKLDSFWVYDGDSEDWMIINELFSVARRSALAIDNTIQGMLSELGKNGTVGKKTEKKGDNDGWFTGNIPF